MEENNKKNNEQNNFNQKENNEKFNPQKVIINKKKNNNTPNNNFEKMDINNNNIHENKIGNNFITPGNDPELNNYYEMLHNEKKQNLFNNFNKNNLRESIESNNDLVFKTAFSLNIYKKAPNVILESEEKSNYIKSIIILLSNVKPIANYYLKENSKFKHHIKDLPMSYYLSRIIFHFYPYPENSLQKSFSLSTFLKVINYFNHCFGLEKENVPIYFLHFLLDMLHNDDKKLRNNLNLKENIEENNNKKFKEYIEFLAKNEKSCIFENFCWINQKIKKCLECSFESIEYSKNFIYELKFEEMIKNNEFNCNKKISILDCIKYQSKKIKMKSGCKNCKKQNFFEESLIRISPKYFIFNLGSVYFIKKNFDKIKIDEELYLYDIVKEENLYNRYILSGKIVYDPDLKEYFAFCCSPVDKNYYNYQKNSIIKIEKNKFIESYVYNFLPIILIYEHN